VEPKVLDVGVGSGAIALAIADEHPGARVIATDSSPEALAVAAENAGRTGLRIELVQGELLAGLDGAFDLVVSNPPYVSPDEIAALPLEVGEHEPREALLDSGATEAIAEQALPVLLPGGSLALEVADGKAHGVARRLNGLGYEGVTIGKDLAGNERVVDGRAPC
jgi:release factor glutamine methyltransferase